MERNASSSSSSSFVGRGSRHDDADVMALPPALRLTKMITDVLATWVTAESLVGNLDDLQKKVENGRRT